VKNSEIETGKNEEWRLIKMIESSDRHKGHNKKKLNDLGLYYCFTCGRNVILAKRKDINWHGNEKELAERRKKHV
jgi:hypothetical protein